MIILLYPSGARSVGVALVLSPNAKTIGVISASIPNLQGVFQGNSFTEKTLPIDEALPKTGINSLAIVSKTATATTIALLFISTRLRS